VLTRDPERKRRLYELHFEQPMVLQAPLVITFCADWYRPGYGCATEARTTTSTTCLGITSPPLMR
jgi:hypothetical protein